MRNRDVFINCPFSSDYISFFRAIVFTVIYSGYRPRCALEADNGAENRFNKICQIIGECRLGIHDISKTEPDAKSKLPRFNMPLELGLFLAAKRFGSGPQKDKLCIILDRKRYRYQTFISDIAGQDIHAHAGKIGEIVKEIAAWLRDEARDPDVPGGIKIGHQFRKFSRLVPSICREKNLEPGEMTFRDFRKIAEEWIIQADPIG